MEAVLRDLREEGFVVDSLVDEEAAGDLWRVIHNDLLTRSLE
jgi:hypothetical protein